MKPSRAQFGKRVEGDNKTGDAMTREDVATERALKMHDLALSVVRSKGLTKLEGSTTVLEYRYGQLMIQYRSGKGELDVWFERRVLSVERFAWKPQIIRYTSGYIGRLGAPPDQCGEGGCVTYDKRALELYRLARRADASSRC